jgi:hypothetical protein
MSSGCVGVLERLSTLILCGDREGFNLKTSRDVCDKNLEGLLRV